MWNRSLQMTSLMTSLMSCCFLLSGCEPSGPPPEALSTYELCELGAYIGIAVVSSDPDDDGGGGGDLKVGDVCPECRGAKEVGDGTIMMKCERCKGTGKVQPDDPELGGMGAWTPDGSPKRCLCDHNCDCSGSCDPCDCIFCLPKKKTDELWARIGEKQTR